jgi:CelD/BcsL family acetyltransferase involved in cellulose biosynthesis
MKGTTPGPSYVVDVSTELAPFLARWGALLQTGDSPFQGLNWLRAWYETLGTANGRTPVLVGVRRADTHEDVMLLPLSARRRGIWSVLEFADADVMDYTGPWVSPHWAGTHASPAEQTRQAQHLWHSLAQALGGHDVWRLNKMLARPLPESTVKANPLRLALRARLQPCEMFGNAFHVPGSWDDWRHTLDKRVRKEFERAWRVFTRSEEARFEQVTDAREAEQLFATLEVQQSRRMNEVGVRYVLDEPPYRAFYGQALRDGLASGEVVLTALRDGDQVVAAQLGVASGQRYIALRLSTGGDAWKACSPGRLLCERTARHLHEKGLKWFDFGIGDYQHKQMFDVGHIALVDGCEALSWRGQPLAWHWRFRRAMKRQTWLVALVRRLKR